MYVKLKKRIKKGKYIDIYILLLGSGIAILLSAIIFLIYKVNPLSAFILMIKSSFFTSYGLSQTLIKTVPLALCAYSVILCYKIKLWNIGAEGQLYMGGLVASIVALKFHIEIKIFSMLILIIISAFAGAFWCFIACYFKIKFNVNEILSTLMLNYVAIKWVEFFAYGPLKGKDRFPYSEIFPAAMWLPQVYKNVHIGIIFVVLIGIGLYILINFTTFGFRIKVCGDESLVAEYAGLNRIKYILIISLISGACAGLAGMIEVCGVQHRLQPVISNGYGFTAILVAWLAGQSFLYSILVAFLFGGLFVGGEEIQIAYGLKEAVVGVIQGIIFISVLGSSVFKDYTLEVKK